MQAAATAPIAPGEVPTAPWSAALGAECQPGRRTGAQAAGGYAALVAAAAEIKS